MPQTEPKPDAIRAIIDEHPGDSCAAAIAIHGLLLDHGLTAFRRGRTAGFVAGRLQGLDEAASGAVAGIRTIKREVQPSRRSLFFSGFGLMIGGLINATHAPGRL